MFSVQRPAYYLPLWFVYAFVYLAFFFAVVSGWRRMASRFPLQQWPDAKWFGWQSGEVGLVGYSKLLKISISARGLGLIAAWPFGLWHPPLLIPWNEITQTEEAWSWRGRGRTLTIGSPRWASVRLNNQQLIEAANVYLPPT